MPFDFYDEPALDSEGHASPAAAVHYYEARLAEAPWDIEAYNSLGLALLTLDRIEAAESVFQRGLQQCPMDTDCQLGLAYCRYRQWDFTAAIEVYESLYAWNPDPQFRVNTFICLLCLDRVEEAVELFETLPLSLLDEETRATVAAALGKARATQARLVRRIKSGRLKNVTVMVTRADGYVVGLLYRQGTHTAPVLVVKGKGLMALLLIEAARRQGIPCVDHSSLAVIIHDRVTLGQYIRPEQYDSVSELLAAIIT